ncbi:hypothetical protein V6N11_080420 [Hibiscus sabdariffa]|uniref:Uncharacterized protein n=1 Tax=Hibiscus sabdariffa TaxID=183260 RepID=A0ABR2R7W6_9ROSI
MPQSIATNSRYNPIFIETDPAIETSEATDVAPISNVQHALPTSALNQNAMTGKSKLKAKAQFVPRKSSSLILKPRDPNVMPKKSASGFASTSGTSRKSSLNPSKHIVVTTSVSTPPIMVNRDKQ